MKRRKELIKRYSSLTKIRNSSVDELSEIVHDIHFKISGGKEDLLIE